VFSYAEFAGRARRLVSALARRRIGVGDTVAVMAPNVPAMDPVLELIGDVAQCIPAHEPVVAVGVEEPDDALGLLERLDHPVEQDPIKASVPEPNATLVMLVERVHGVLPRGEIPGAYRHERVYGRWPFPARLGPGRRRRDHVKITGGAQPRASAASDPRGHLHALHRRDIKGEALG
jgi:hypothetical protein